jgi:hypothetical protein
MGAESTAGLGRWRDARRARTGPDPNRVSAKKWLGSTLLAALLALAAGLVIWILWLIFVGRETKPDFIAMFIGRYEDPGIPPIPQAEADRDWIQQETDLSSTDTPEKDDKLTLEVIRTRLERLRGKGRDDAVVFYLSTHAVVDADGNVQLLARDSHTFTPDTLLPLEEVIDALRQCPSRKKLLVLDVMPASGGLLELGATEDAAADLIDRELARSDKAAKPGDPPLAVLVPCSPGEVALWSASLGRSVFGHFFAEGLRDREADADGNGWISVEELAKYLTRRVDAWSRHHRDRPQRPRRLGKTEPFYLASLDRRKPKPPVEVEEAPKDAKAEAPAEPSKTAEGKAEAKGEEKKEAEKGQGEPKSKDQKDEAKEAAKLARTGRVYPDWLVKRWELRERWASGREIAEAPRLFRRLEALLLSSDQDWRLGRDAETIKAKLGKEIGDLDTWMKEALKEGRPRPERSAGQALAFGVTADGPLAKALEDLLERERHPDAQTGEDRKKQRDEGVGAFLKNLKDKTSLALAIVKAAKDARFDVDTVQLLDSIVSRSMLRREGDLIELRLLHQLAQLAGKVRPEDWNDELAKSIWETVVLAEQANNRPRTFRWVRGMLEKADALRHEAEIRLLPQAEGFTTPKELERCWEEVADRYKSIDALQTTIDRAREAVILARATLPAYISYQEASPEPDRPSEWREAARTAQDLDTELESSGQDIENNPPGGDRLKDLEEKLTVGTPKLQTQLNHLLKPFRTEDVRDVIARCRDLVPDPRLGREVQALLGTPFLRPSDRQELWKISLDLDRRLGEQPDDRDGNLANPGGSSDRLQAVRALAGLRWDRLDALLKMADPKATARGLEPAARQRRANQSGEAEEQPPEELLARTWGDLWRAAREVHEKVTGALGAGEDKPGEDRPAWVLPALGLEVKYNPVGKLRDRQDLTAWTWLASRYLHVYHDLQGLKDPDPRFFEAASLDCPREGGGNQDPVLRLNLLDLAGGMLRLSSKNESTDVVRVVLEGSLDKETVTMSVIDTGDSRLKVSTPPEGFALAPADPTPIRLQVGWDDRGTDVRNEPPKGVIVRASLVGGKAFHLLVPIEILPPGAIPRLALRPADPPGAADVPFNPLRLRTLPDKQSFFVVVRNPPSKERKVIVEVLDGDPDGDQVIATSASKDKPELVVPSDRTVRVSLADPSGKPADAKPTDPLQPAPQKLSLRLRDAAGGQVYDRQELRPVIASPDEYIAVSAEFIPHRSGKPNSLKVALRALPEMTGPPCPVKLDIPSDSDLFPGFVEPPGGSLKGQIERGGKPLELRAEDIKVGPVDDLRARFSLSVDGIERALWYQTLLVPGGPAQKVEPVEESRVRFRPDLKVEPDKPARLTVHFKVDNAPGDAILYFRLGRSERGAFKDEIEWRGPAKERHLGFDPHSKEGAVRFEARVEDWSKDFDVSGKRGRWRLYAYLLGARDGKVLDSWGWPEELPLDDAAPQITQLEPPAEIESAETRLRVQATVKPSESGIKEVSFIVGPKGDFAKAETKPVPGKPSSGDPSTWEATLKVPPGAAGKLIVSARAISGAGLSAIEEREVSIKEPPPEPAKTAAKPVEEKPGAIKGKVTENDVAQPGLTVYLVDLNAKDKPDAVKRTAKTAPDGTYSFTDLKPGSYQLTCARPPMNRYDIKDVKVGSGQTVEQDLDLLLH